MTEPLDDRLLQLSPKDNTAVARLTIPQGTVLRIAGAAIALGVDVPTGHKVAIREIARGEKVLKYGASIGSATETIPPGAVVHTHNLRSDYLPTFARGHQTS